MTMAPYLVGFYTFRSRPPTTALLPKGTTVRRRWVGQWKPIVTEDLSAQATRGIRLFSKTPLPELGHDLFDELRVAPRDSGVDDVDAVDAGLLPRGELLRDLFRRACDTARPAILNGNVTHGRLTSHSRCLRLHPVEYAADAFDLNVGCIWGQT